MHEHIYTHSPSYSHKYVCAWRGALVNDFSCHVSLAGAAATALEEGVTQNVISEEFGNRTLVDCCNKTAQLEMFWWACGSVVAPPTVHVMKLPY